MKDLVRSCEIESSGSLARGAHHSGDTLALVPDSVANALTSGSTPLALALLTETWILAGLFATVRAHLKLGTRRTVLPCREK